MSALNPDCEQGKHAACSGTAWDFPRDDLAPCACTCHSGADAERRRMVALWAERYPGLPT